MPKRKLPSRVRYDLANPTISVRVSKDEYDRLDYLRASDGVTWKDILLSALDEPENEMLQLGSCSVCKREYGWNIENPGTKMHLDDIVNQAHPKCKKCRESEKS